MPDGSSPSLAPKEVAEAIKGLLAVERAAMVKMADRLAHGLNLRGEDLLHTALVQLLEGKRRFPPDVPPRTVVWNAMRSCAANAQRKMATTPQAVSLVTTSAGEEGAVDVEDNLGNPERKLLARSELEALHRRFAGDHEALGVLMARTEGMPAGEAQEVLGLTPNQYDSAWKRIRRWLGRASGGEGG